MRATPKKSETLEVRLPYETKAAFMAHCRDTGLSASEAVRADIERRLSPGVPRTTYTTWRWIAGGLIAAAVGAAAAPSLAGASPSLSFQRLDADGDGRISAAEFARLDTNRDGAVSAAEYRAAIGH